MNFDFLSNVPWFGPNSKRDMSATHICASVLTEAPKHRAPSEVKFWGWFLISFFPWAMKARDKIKIPTTVNKKLKKHAGGAESSTHYPTLRFRPYVSKVQWHTGSRAFLSRLFPRYGNYCGPNWSSGKDGGSLLWDRRPIDWLDFCCYCHDIGYDTHDQAELLKADLAFLECLEKPHMSTNGDAQIAHVYKMMCISGLRNVLIPYRQHLLKLQSGQLSVGFGWLSNMKWKGWIHNPNSTPYDKVHDFQQIDKFDSTNHRR